MTHALPDKPWLEPPSTRSGSLFTWQTITLSTLFVGYTLKFYPKFLVKFTNHFGLLRSVGEPKLAWANLPRR